MNSPDIAKDFHQWQRIHNNQNLKSAHEGDSFSSFPFAPPELDGARVIRHQIC